MAKKLYEESDIQAIADAIREKNGTTDTYTVAEMEEGIKKIVPTSNTVILGYYLNDTFWTDSTYQTETTKSESIIYIDRNTRKLYIYDGLQYKCIDDELSKATSEVAGILKLYNTYGENEDGTITQKFFTGSIDNIHFAIDGDDAECLILNKL